MYGNLLLERIRDTILDWDLMRAAIYSLPLATDAHLESLSQLIALTLIVQRHK